MHKGAHHLCRRRSVTALLPSPLGVLKGGWGLADAEKGHAVVRMAHIEVPLTVVEHTTAAHGLFQLHVRQTVLPAVKPLQTAVPEQEPHASGLTTGNIGQTVDHQ